MTEALGLMRPASEGRLQSGVLAYRTRKSGKVEVLLIGRGKGRRWGIPKGKAEAGLLLPDNAAKEAFEEAGLFGTISPHAAGRFRTIKRVRGDNVFIEVWVYLLEVSGVASDWPEKRHRRTKWVSCHKAADMLQEPLLKELCARLNNATSRKVSTP